MENIANTKKPERRSTRLKKAGRRISKGLLSRLQREPALVAGAVKVLISGIVIFGPQSLKTYLSVDRQAYLDMATATALSVYVRQQVTPVK